MAIYKHNKTGKLYQLYQVADTMGILKVINTTNGKEMIMYLDPKKPNKIFVREKKEFNEKFTLLKTSN